MPLKTVALVAAVCVTIGWLLAATLTPPVARLQSLPDKQPRPVTTDPTPFVTQLNLRLRQVPLPPTPGRNPFSFGERPRHDEPLDEPPTAANSAATVLSTPVGPAYTLSGIGITGTLLTAVLTDGQEVRIVKLDDSVGEYTIVDITDSSVTLAAANGERHTLHLR